MGIETPMVRTRNVVVEWKLPDSSVTKSNAGCKVRLSIGPCEPTRVGLVGILATTLWIMCLLLLCARATVMPLRKPDVSYIRHVSQQEAALARFLN